MRKLICDHADTCRDPICRHTDPHTENWWCDREQTCTTWRGESSKERAVCCKHVNADKWDE